VAKQINQIEPDDVLSRERCDPATYTHAFNVGALPLLAGKAGTDVRPLDFAELLTRS